MGKKQYLLCGTNANRDIVHNENSERNAHRGEHQQRNGRHHLMAPTPQRIDEQR